ncbi:MAG: hypothetical protein KJ017_02445 [Alphaproteobacteria bacterium]|nr:hypothetical protein [Alphaproteobacteria bacterium]
MTALKPSREEVKRYLDEWKKKEASVHEKSLDKLFRKTYPCNTDIDNVLIKVSSLNNLYSTRIFKPYVVAEHVVNLNIDQRLLSEDLSLVKDLAWVEVEEGTYRHFYSFATKYCSFHRPEAYPMYDWYVFKMLEHFKNLDGFYDFKNAKLRDYPTYHKTLLQFRHFYQLEDFSLNQIDKYLWQAGKEKFSIKE